MWLNENSFVLTPNGFVKASALLPKSIASKKSVIYKTVYGKFIFPQDSKILGKASNDFSEDICASYDSLDVGDYLYVPYCGYTFSCKYFFPVKEYLIDGLDYCYLKNHKEANILKKSFKKDLSEVELKELTCKYGTQDLQEIYKQFKVTNVIKGITNLPIDEILMYFLYKSLVGQYQLESTLLTLTDVSEQEALLLNTYFKDLNYITSYSKHVSYNFIDKSYKIYSNLFITLFRNSFDDYSLLKYTSLKMFSKLCTYFSVYKHKSIIVKNIKILKLLQFKFLLHKQVVGVDENNLILTFNVSDYFIHIKNKGYLFEITSKTYNNKETYFLMDI